MLDFMNVIFPPLWLMLAFPMFWLIVIPCNYLIDTAIVMVTMKVMKREDIKENYFKSIVWVVLFGLISDVIGGLFMLLSIPMADVIKVGGLDGDFAHFVLYDPFSNPIALLWVLAAIVITCIFIYLFNSKISFKKTNLEPKQIKRISLAMALLTPPLLFLIPSFF